MKWALGLALAASVVCLDAAQVIVIVPAETLHATVTYYVRTDGNNANTGLANTAGGAWLTIDYAADHVVANDIVRVQAGTYLETATPGISGTLGKTVTLVADGSVIICGMTFSGKSFIRVIGFTMDPSTGGCTANSNIVTVSGINTGLEFWNNTIQNTNNNAFFIDSNERCNSCIIVGGAIQNIHINAGTCAGGLTVTGNDVFVGYIDFSTICYVGVLPSGNRLRLVHLNFSGLLQEGSAHPDNYYIQGNNPFGYANSLIESNYGIGTVSSIDNKWFHAQNTSGTIWLDDVWRQNVSYNLGSGFFSVYDTGAQISRFHYYHNTIVKCQRANNDASADNCGNFSAQVGNGVSASIYNNVFYQAWSDVATTNLVVWSESFGPVITKDYNLAFSALGSDTFTSQWTGQAHEQSNVDPVFVNAASDFTLQSGSGARGAGGPLTTTNGSGTNSVNLIVAAGTGSMFIGSNATNLSQYGGALVPGDEITVGSTNVRVSNVAGDTLYLASPISWSNGDSVYFGSTTTVDIGAYPYKAGGYTLTATWTQDGSQRTIVPSDASLVRFVICYEGGIPTTIDNASPYICSITGIGTVVARVYPRYAGTTQSVVATP